MKILHIDSSANLSKSFSRTYSKKVVDRIHLEKKDCQILRRDLVVNTIPCITEEWWNSAYLSEERKSECNKTALAISDSLINEIFASDYIVIGSPMHNFSISSYLKLYFDQICRSGKTFSESYEGLVKNKKAFVVMTRAGAGYEEGEPHHNKNFQEGYIKTILGFIGITNVQWIKISGLAYGDDKVKIACDSAEDQIRNLII